MKTKTGISFLVAISSILLIFVFPLQGLSADSVFSFVNDLSRTQTTTIKVTGQGSLDIPPDAVFVRLDVRSTPSEDLAKVLDDQQYLVAELFESLGETGESLDDFQVSRTNNGRIYAQQHRMSDPSQSSYLVDFRTHLKVPYDQTHSIFKDLSSNGFVVEGVRIVQEKDNSEAIEPTNSATISIPHGTAIPSCEESNSCYVPYEIVISPGTKVTWTNDDDAAHTVTSGSPDGGPDGIFDSALFMAGESFSHSFLHSGSFEYFCMVHPWMLGKVTVSGNTGDATSSYGLFAEFDVFSQSAPDTFDNTISEYDESMATLRSILEKHGVDSKSLNDRPIRIDERYSGYGDPYYYESRDTIMIRTSIENIITVLDVAMNHNIRIQEITPTYLPSTLENARTTLAKLALDDAKSTIMDLVGPDGLEVKGVKSIEINTSQQINPQYEGIVISGVGVNLDRNYYDLSPLFTKVQVEFEVGR
ncbi:MAG: hypothetical protein K5790_01505 [Nitrosopumilus sp.]|uniref:plastocyanin/azurin family copper-binding protein n=1 Tax=Nitrosopumilus sp. TaxID=2024843 RepID=UPI00247B62C4|nr:plastocyanin/azurin family copper-binding protein [Nitrosopumilus sp.]MCV0391950.1 hypothetical protein [Nitrosopumilus sp.]